MSQQCGKYEEADHLRLMCYIHMGLENWTHIFGPRDRLRGQSRAGRVAENDRSQARQMDSETFKRNGGRRQQRTGGHKKHRGLESTQGDESRAGGQKTGVSPEKTSHQAAKFNGKARINALRPPSNKNSGKLFASNYLSNVTVSLDSESVHVVFDSGNGGPTIFPRRLLPFAANLKQSYSRISCAGRAENFVETSHCGEVTFLAPTDAGTTTKIELHGYFMCEADSFHDEVLISRYDMPLAPGLNEGTNFAITGQLKKYPGVLFGLDAELKQSWKVCPPKNRALRRVRGKDMVWTDEKAIEDWSDEFEFDLGEMREHCSAKH